MSGNMFNTYMQISALMKDVDNFFKKASWAYVSAGPT